MELDEETLEQIKSMRKMNYDETHKMWKNAIKNNGEYPPIQTMKLDLEQFMRFSARKRQMEKEIESEIKYQMECLEKEKKATKHKAQPVFQYCRTVIAKALGAVGFEIEKQHFSS